MALAFSPTVVESGERTMLPLYGAMMLAALLKLDCTGLSPASLETALVASFRKKPALGEKNRELLQKALATAV